MTDEPMNPYRKQAVDWLKDFANLAEGKSVNGVDGDPASDSRVALALRVAAQQIAGLPDPRKVNLVDDSYEKEPTSTDQPKTDMLPESNHKAIDPSGDVAQQIASRSNEELDQAMAASVPPEPAPDEAF